ADAVGPPLRDDGEVWSPRDDGEGRSPGDDGDGCSMTPLRADPDGASPPLICKLKEQVVIVGNTILYNSPSNTKTNSRKKQRFLKSVTIIYMVPYRTISLLQLSRENVGIFQ